MHSRAIKSQSRIKSNNQRTNSRARAAINPLGVSRRGVVFLELIDGPLSVVEKSHNLKPIRLIRARRGTMNPPIHLQRDSRYRYSCVEKESFSNRSSTTSWRTIWFDYFLHDSIPSDIFKPKLKSFICPFPLFTLSDEPWISLSKVLTRAGLGWEEHQPEGKEDTR